MKLQSNEFLTLEFVFVYKLILDNFRRRIVVVLAHYVYKYSVCFVLQKIMFFLNFYLIQTV